MTPVAVVILNFNGEKLLQQFLPSVIEHSSQAKIIVVDNGSTDSSVSLLKKSFPKVDLLLFEKNLGYSGGYNTALTKIDSEIVVLLNSDVEVTRDWLTSPLKLLNSNSNVVAVQPKILAYHQKNQFEYAGAAGGFIDTMGYPFCRGRIFNTVEKDKGQYNDLIEIFWASGACLFIKKDKYLEVGGLDVDFFAHMEEIDLCWRLHRAGFSIFYDGESVVYHVGGATLAAGSPRKVFFNFKNGLTLLIKNLPAGELVYKFPLRIFLDWAAALDFLLHGFGRSCLAVLKAHVYFFAGMGNDFSKRKKWSHLGFSVKPTLILNKMIVVDYFLKGKREYPDVKNPK